MICTWPKLLKHWYAFRLDLEFSFIFGKIKCNLDIFSLWIGSCRHLYFQLHCVSPPAGLSRWKITCNHLLSVCFVRPVYYLKLLLLICRRLAGHRIFWRLPIQLEDFFGLFLVWESSFYQVAWVHVYTFCQLQLELQMLWWWYGRVILTNDLEIYLLKNNCWQQFCCFKLIPLSLSFTVLYEITGIWGKHAELSSG